MKSLIVLLTGVVCITTWLRHASGQEAAAAVQAAEQAARAVVVQSFGGTPGRSLERAAPQDPVERLLILTSDGPVCIQVAVTIDGQPFRMVLERMFQEHLVEIGWQEEAKWDDVLRHPRLLFGRFAGIARADAQRAQYIATVDHDRDGLADRDEVRTLFTSGFGQGPFNVTPGLGGMQAGAPDLRPVLDDDRDGGLSAEELSAAPARLLARDANDNELLEAFDLAPPNNNPQRLRSGAYSVPARRLTGIFDPEGTWQELTNRYGRSGVAIPAEAWPHRKSLVAELDANRNGAIDEAEVLLLPLATPHVVLAVRFGESTAGPPGVTIVQISPELQAADEAQDTNRSSATIRLRGSELRFGFADVPASQNYGPTAQAMIRQFDKDQNGYIEKTEIPAQQAQYYETQFQVWDADGDGKVYPAEIEKSYERQQAPLRGMVRTEVSEQPPGLFAALDASGDNRLGLREMRTAAAGLQKLDRNADGALSADEMPAAFVLNFARGNAFGRGAGGLVVSFGGGAAPAAAPAAAGPAWFVRMDRNGDGDLTPREFLGTAAQFEKLDANADGFIERGEAERGE